jgi:hypothetical protein
MSHDEFEILSFLLFYLIKIKYKIVWISNLEAFILDVC